MHEATSFQSSGSENSSHSLNVERNASSALLVSEIFAQSAVSKKKIERTFKSELIRCNRQHRHDRETWFTSPVFGYRYVTALLLYYSSPISPLRFSHARNSLSHNNQVCPLESTAELYVLF